MTQRIMITGSAGFIGSQFVRQVIYQQNQSKNKPYTFCSVDRVNANSTNAIYSNKNHTFYPADIRDQHVMDIIFQTEKPDIVIHMAASSSVDKSLVDPNDFVSNNVLGTQVMINCAVKHKVKKMIYCSCYDETTRAVTREGFKFWHELKEGDMVLSINSQTGVVEEKPIEKIIVQNYAGDMLSFNSRRVDLLTTPNHNFICSKYTNKNITPELDWYTGEELELLVGRKNYLPTGKIMKPLIKTINIPELGLLDAEAFFYVCGVFIGDGFNAYQEKKVKNKSGLSKQEMMTKARDPKTGRFFKTVIRGAHETSLCKSYRIFFDVPENDKARQHLEKALTKLGIKFTRQKNKSGEHVYFSSQKWMEFFEQFGKYAANKHIPEWMLDYDQELLYLLWKGIHDSDGYGLDIKGCTSTITTVSTKLTSQLCYLGTMIGYSSSFSLQHSESEIDGRIIEGDAFYIRFSDKRKPLIPRPKRVNYDGKIWCLKVADNKNFLVERNGKVAFSGNTDEIYGQLTNEQDQSWTERDIPNPRNPYSVSKLCGELLVKTAYHTHGLNYNITRSSNCFGPRQLPDKLIPKVIKCILNQAKIPIYGQGLQIRDWTFVADHCSALMTILEKGESNSIYNISANQEFSNIEAVYEICKYMKAGEDLIEFITDPRGNSHDFRYSVNSDKLRALGWKPTVQFKKDLGEQCISWYLDNKNWWFV